MKLKLLLMCSIILVISNTSCIIPQKISFKNKKEIKKYSGYNGKEVLDIFSTKGQVIILFKDGTNLEIKKTDL